MCVALHCNVRRALLCNVRRALSAVRCNVMFAVHCTVVFAVHCTVMLVVRCAVMFAMHCTVMFAVHCTPQCCSAKVHSSERPRGRFYFKSCRGICFSLLCSVSQFFFHTKQFVWGLFCCCCFSSLNFQNFWLLLLFAFRSDSCFAGLA